MRRLTLSTKLFAAALPLVVAVGTLLALTVRGDLQDVRRAESGAELGGVWDPLITALTAVEAEVGQLEAGASVTPADLAAGRRATDQAVNDLRTVVERLGAANAASEHITSSRSWLSAARRNLDMSSLAPDMQTELDPLVAYDSASRQLVSVGQLLPSEAGDPALGRELLAVVKLAEAKLAATNVLGGTAEWPNPSNDRAPLLQARNAFTELDAVLSEFQAIAPADWAAQYRKSGFTSALATYRSQLDTVVRAADRGEIQTFDNDGFTRLIGQGVQFQSDVSQSIVDRADAQVNSTRRTALTRIGVTLGAVLMALVITWMVNRSVTRRVKAVATSANLVASEQLPALVEALRDPRGRTVLPEIDPVDARGGDELAELAEAFNSMQGTLTEVAQEQVEVLRRGVSDIFITMARRNRSLIDRQLAMLDEFEAEVDDPDVLANYYQLDHMATRMRRNSESLLVLANAEPKRRRVKATEIDDVVRAAIGEVEDYKRIDIEALESLQVKGNVVADVSHLLAELLDNATAFSPPDSHVRVGGRRTGDSYMLRIVDNGVGIGPDRLRELNEVLRNPPVVGLAVESTLGMSVVSLLASKHAIEVTLSAGNPGLTVDVVLPASLFGPIDVPFGGAAPATAPAPAPAAVAPVEPAPIVDWTAADQRPGTPVDESFVEVPAAAAAPVPLDDEPRVTTSDWATVAPVPLADEPRITTPGWGTVAPVPLDDEPRVTTSDWSSVALDLSAFQSGRRSAAEERAGSFEMPTPATAPRYDEPAPAAPPALSEPTIPSVSEPTVPTVSEPPEPGPAWSDRSLPGLGQAPAPTVHSDTFAPAPAAPSMPPPPPSRVHGEFDVPPAPPITTDGLSRRPVTPATAHPAPRPSNDLAFGPPALPTRSPGRGPDGGPDRLAGSASAGAGEPSALQAALAAFDTGRNTDPSSLPTRVPIGDPVQPLDEPLSTTASRLDPDALRQRLRAFQSEFRTGLTGPGEGSKDLNHNTDLGGDRR